MAMDRGQNQVMSQVREGMSVVDASGETIGKVAFVRMGDPQAAEIEEPQERAPGAGLLDVLDPDNDNNVTERMLQRGYIKIDVEGLFEGDKYVLSDDVEAVEGQTVRLARAKDDIGDPA